MKLTNIFLIFIIFLIVLTAGCSDIGKPKNRLSGELSILDTDPGLEGIKLDKKAKDLFENEHPGVTINFIYTTQDNYIGDLNALIEKDAPPDILILRSSFNNYMILEENGYALNLENIAKVHGVNLEDYFERSILELATFDDQLLAIPYSASPLVVYYNKEWFDHANIPYPQDGWTWEEFADIAKKLKESTDDERFKYPAVYNSIISDLSPLIFSKGGSYISPDGTEVKGYMDSEMTINAIEWYQEQVANKVLDTKIDYQPPYNLADSIRVIGMLVDIPYFSALDELKDQFDIVGLPYFSGGSRTNTARTAGAALTKQSKNPNLAWEFLKFCTMDRNELTEDKFGYISKSLIKGSRYESYREVIQNELRFVKKTAADVNMYWLPSLQSEFKQGLENIIFSSTDIQHSLSSLAEQIDRKLAEIKN